MYISGNIRNPKKVAFSTSDYPVLFTHVGVGECDDIDEAIKVEREKISSAITLGADVICDVSMAYNLEYVHKKLLEGFDVPFGVVTAYEAFINTKDEKLKCDSHLFVELFEEEVKRGFDIITIHATVNKDDRKLIYESNRLISTTSRGGMLLLQMMEANDFENPFVTHYDEILEIAKRNHIWISLGPCYRPASVADCNQNDSLHLLELERMSVLVKKALDKGVNVTIEGIGHAPLNKIGDMIKIAKEKCFNVPYRCMTVSCDVALGFDHISSAISSATAIYQGADSITCVTRSEHIGIPSLEEVKEGVIAAKIAIYSGYIARSNDFSKDIKMSKAREATGCLGHLPSTLFPNQIHEIVSTKDCKRSGKSCTMCGEFCPLNKLK